jgi:PhoD-like phosphatase
MAELLLGPVVRYVGAADATVWVETDGPCEVEILGRVASTFRVGDRHYALVVITGLERASSVEYEVRLDGRLWWPPADSVLPASRIQTLPERGAVSIVWGSCRVSLPHEPPYTLGSDEHELGAGVDALQALAFRLHAQHPESWPRLLLLIGDQVYADAVPPQTRAFIRGRRDVRRPPGEQVADFDEYTHLYREAWSPPAIRWLLSTVPSAMIFDDHDVHDDWNISESWLREMRAEPWWQEKIVGALASYWIYQHLGNLSPSELERDALYQRVLQADDAAPVLREFAVAAAREGGGRLWSYSRRITGSRLIVLDAREGRVLDGGQRKMLDEQAWAWVEEQLTGDFDHVLVASTLPVLLPPTLYYVEAWSEAICEGRWGGLSAQLGEKVRRVLDLEHWAAFQDSFHRLIGMVEQVAAGEWGTAPASILLLGGDVHNGYVEAVGFPRGRGVRSGVYQAVCSPFRNQLPRAYRVALTLARRSRALRGLARCAARAAGVRDPGIRWKPIQEPTFYNHLGRLEIDGRALSLAIEYTRPNEEPRLHALFRRRLA